MKAILSFQDKLRTAAAFCIALLLSATITSCSDSDDENNSGQEPGKDDQTITYNDLSYFQNSIIEIDSLGNFVSQYFGKVLYDDAPEHLYIGVDTYEEAENLFRLWIAPDVTLPAAAPLTAQLTDNEGKAQGSVTFAKATGNGAVAEVTASAGTQLKHFNKITFLLNSAWPHNAATPIHHVGDVISHALVGVDTRLLADNDRVLKWVCIQEEGNGIPPIFIAITRNAYDRGSDDKWEVLKKSRYCPRLERATAISNILRTRWDMYCVMLDEAGCGSLRNDGFWINYHHKNFLYGYDEYMYYASGLHYGANTAWTSDDHDMKLPFLFRIDWMSDSDVSAMMVPTAGTDIPGHGESYANLFDNNTTTKWYVQAAQKQEGAWFVEFNAEFHSKPTGYKLFTANDTQKYPHRNPVAWKLFGKYAEADSWTLLDERNAETKAADALPEANEAGKAFTFANDKLYKFYRLEISKSKGDSDMQLSKFLLTYE